MTDREYALFLFERQKRDHFRRLKAQIRARLTRHRTEALTQPTTNDRQPRTTTMGFHKHYLNDLVCACVPDNGFAQEAIEHAIVSGWVTLSGAYDLETDTIIVMNHYDQIISRYHTHIHGRDRNQLATEVA